MTFGNAVREARLTQKMSQGALAKRIVRPDGRTLSTQYINNLEHGNDPPPSAALIVQMCEVLGLSESYMLYLAQKFPPRLTGTPYSKETIERAFAALYRELGQQV